MGFKSLLRAVFSVQLTKELSIFSTDGGGKHSFRRYTQINQAELLERRDMKVPDICPRCEFNWIPCNERPGAYPGAISRADNKTEICSECGEHEAIQDFYEGGCVALSQWPVNK